MKPPLRALLAALLLLSPRVGGADAGVAATDENVAAAQGASDNVRRGLDGVVKDVNTGGVAGIYGERPIGDPNAASAGAPRGTGASVNLTATLPEVQFPKDFQREAVMPPNVEASAPSSSGGGGLFSWFTSAPQQAPAAQPIANPSFSRPCPSGQAGCVETMTLSRDTPIGVQQFPLSDFVEYGKVKYKGKDDTQLWDKRPWWKFWADPRQVSPDDIKQGGLNDCFLMSSLAAIANKEPQVLRRMIKQQQGTLSAWVEFYDGQPAKPVLVGPIDELLPVYKQGQKQGDGSDLSGHALFAKPSGEQGAIWPLLIEKAYTIKFQDNSYAQMKEGGVGSVAMTRITGQPSRMFDIDAHEQWYKDVSMQDLVDWDSSLQPIIMLTKFYPKDGCPPAPSASAPPGTAAAAQPPLGTSIDICVDPLYKGKAACLPGSQDPVCADPGKIVTLDDWHVYWVKKVDAGAQTVTLANPLAGGRPDVTLPWSRFKKSLHYVFINDKAP